MFARICHKQQSTSLRVVLRDAHQFHHVRKNKLTDSLFFPFKGGLLICLPREQAARFCAEIKSPKYGEGHQAWIIGIVEKGNRTARIIDKPRIIEVAPQAATQNVNPTPGATS